MIDKKPTPGNWSDWAENPYSDRSTNGHAPYLHDTPPVRKSSVLGPDGNPVMVDVPRARLGFDIWDKKK